MIVYAAYFETNNDDENAKRIDPQIGFLELPSRKFVDRKLMKNSEELRMVMHPQGFYLGVINQYKTKKTKQWAVEIFDLTP